MIIKKLLANKSNYTKNRTKKIEYIVIHYTANNGDTAKGNCNYFNFPNRNASAHYFVDEKEIWQSVEDSDIAWHCGTNGKYYHSKCRNDNAIGIELCSEKDSKGNYYFNKETIKNAIELTKMLMKKYNIPIENILRHYDVTKKVCPAPFVNNTIDWYNFKELVEGDYYLKINRNYSYNNVVKSFTVINEDGENYIRVRDLANLLNKNLAYDNNTKITKLEDILQDIRVETDDRKTTVKSINSEGFNFVKVRDIADFLGYETGYNESNGNTFFKIKKSILDKFKIFKSR